MNNHCTLNHNYTTLFFPFREQHGGVMKSDATDATNVTNVNNEAYRSAGNDLSISMSKEEIQVVLDDAFKKAVKKREIFIRNRISHTLKPKELNSVLYEIDQIVQKTLSTKFQNIELDEIPRLDAATALKITQGSSFLKIASNLLCVLFYQSLGDTLGYKNGQWEFNKGDAQAGPEYANEMLYEFISLGGINGISLVNWIASDDTVLYLKTFEVLVTSLPNIDTFGKRLQAAYTEAIEQIKDRAPGRTTMRSLNIQKNISWNELPYNSMDNGNGSCMRSGCIGIVYPGKHNRKKLIALAVETSRITHNSAIAILGSVTAALFTAYGIEKVPLAHWPHRLLKLLKSGKVDKYILKSRPKEYDSFMRDKIIFVGQWEKYIAFRFIGLQPRLDIKHMKNLVSRIKYLTDNFSKRNSDNPGGCADDATIIAFDALLEGGHLIEKVIIYSILHYGDSDTVGSIALSWYGAYYGPEPIEHRLAKELEFQNTIAVINSKYNLLKIMKIIHYDLYIHFARKTIKYVLSHHTN